NRATSPGKACGSRLTSTSPEEVWSVAPTAAMPLPSTYACRLMGKLQRFEVGAHTHAPAMDPGADGADGRPGRPGNLVGGELGARVQQQRVAFLGGQPAE